mgnify:CR=1 FL=1
MCQCVMRVCIERDATSRSCAYVFGQAQAKAHARSACENSFPVHLASAKIGDSPTSPSPSPPPALAPTCANHMASASVRRPSASVLFTSTVLPAGVRASRDSCVTRYTVLVLLIHKLLELSE